MRVCPSVCLSVCLSVRLAGRRSELVAECSRRARDCVFVRACVCAERERERNWTILVLIFSSSSPHTMFGLAANGRKVSAKRERWQLVSGAHLVEPGGRGSAAQKLPAGRSLARRQRAMPNIKLSSPSLSPSLYLTLHLSPSLSLLANSCFLSLLHSPLSTLSSRRLGRRATGPLQLSAEQHWTQATCPATRPHQTTSWLCLHDSNSNSNSSSNSSSNSNCNSGSCFHFALAPLSPSSSLALCFCSALLAPLATWSPNWQDGFSAGLPTPAGQINIGCVPAARSLHTRSQLMCASIFLPLRPSFLTVLLLFFFFALSLLLARHPPSPHSGQLASPLLTISLLAQPERKSKRAGQIWDDGQLESGRSRGGKSGAPRGESSGSQRHREAHLSRSSQSSLRRPSAPNGAEKKRQQRKKKKKKEKKEKKKGESDLH